MYASDRDTDVRIIVNIPATTFKYGRNIMKLFTGRKCSDIQGYNRRHEVLVKEYVSGERTVF